MTKLPTQSDVAKLAGVSTATVSRVLNGQGRVSVAVCERVNHAIEQLQYVPHAGARSMALRRTGVLGALIPSLNNAIFAEGIHAFERASQKLGYSLILAVSDAADEHHAAQIDRMLERGVDGLLLVGNDHDHRIFDRLESAGVKYVCTWSYDELARAANIGFDNQVAMFDLVDHLVEIGHRQFGMLAGLTRRNDRARLRVSGVISRLNHHGIALKPTQIVEVPYSINASRRAFWEIIDNDLTALICGNDVIAYGALLEAQKVGLRIPEDLSISGFDDLDLSSELSPSLTTVQVGADVMCTEAAKSLIQAIEQQSDVSSQCFSTRLIVRQTTSEPGYAGA